MNEDKFSSAGKAFRSQQDIKNCSALEQALALLREIQTTCKNGVDAFCANAKIERSDVVIDMASERQIRIRYPYRYGREHGKILIGPCASVFVTPDGKTLIGSDIKWVPAIDRTGSDRYTAWTVEKIDSHRWLTEATYRRESPPLEFVPLDIDNWQHEISDWLINFLTESERLYEVICYRAY